jgi:hypothetical protein
MLTNDQKAWADSHVGSPTQTSEPIDSWTENGDGSVTFTITFTATPPPSAEQLAATQAERAREAAETEAERVQRVAEEQAAAEATAEAQRVAEEDRIRSIVREELAQAQVAPNTAT